MGGMVAATRDNELLLKRAADICRAELDGANAAAVIADNEGAIVFANDRAQTILGGVRIGAGVEDYSCMHGIFTTDGRPFPSSDLPLSRAVLHGENVLGVRLVVRRCDGTASLVSVDAKPLFDGEGDQIGGVATFDEV